jgi:predicted transcriptional regulator
MIPETFFFIFGNRKRLKILVALNELGEGNQYRIGQRAGLGHNQSIHRHLQILEEFHLILSRPTEKLKGTMEYRLNLAHPLMKALRAFIMEIHLYENRLEATV